MLQFPLEQLWGGIIYPILDFQWFHFLMTCSFHFLLNHPLISRLTYHLLSSSCNFISNLFLSFYFLIKLISLFFLLLIRTVSLPVYLMHPILNVTVPTGSTVLSVYFSNLLNTFFKPYFLFRYVFVPWYSQKLQHP